MRLFVDDESREIYGECTACKAEINFTQYSIDTDPWGYYSSEEIVNKWMDHQLNNCGQAVVDNEPKVH